MLPIALVEILNYSYFLHLLATDPASVLPPGKSLLSVMSKPHTTRHDAAEDDLPRLRDRVHDVVHKAFWDEVHILAHVIRIVLTTPVAGSGDSIEPLPRVPDAPSQAAVRRPACCHQTAPPVKPPSTTHTLGSSVPNDIPSPLGHHTSPRDPGHPPIALCPGPGSSIRRPCAAARRTTIPCPDLRHGPARG